MPAVALEHAVAHAIAGHLEGAASSCSLPAEPVASEVTRMAGQAQALAERLRRAEGAGGAGLPARATALRQLVREGRLGSGLLHLALDGPALAAGLGAAAANLAPALLTLAVPFSLRRRGVEPRLVAGSTLPQPDPTLVAALARAHRWARQLRGGLSMARIAKAELTSKAHIRRTRVTLAFLSPRLQAAILAGTRPPELTLERLMRTSLLLDWAAQESRLGLVS